ncbi:hypothetical protein GCG54_00011698 [Colletotrichum gloeosporioides]|uniref:Uncharacterized protein n=1 Tax=Colletotrichum gloeosporioides TaxID=474922 RepID=A0A8H4C5A0_COLGL|nr:uncharacterized protein GCG54_00011698 [Colletotrichum gloeosporioides]KAF3797668.1 hypothetical protein GCG54_00011698 [Colletotrichum gloeosporioides]
MACGSASSGLVNRNGPGSAATSIAESIIKPAEATGGKTKCLEVRRSLEDRVRALASKKAQVCQMVNVC